MENNLKKETIDSFNLDIFFQLHGTSKYAKSDSDFQVIFEREMKELNDVGLAITNRSKIFQIKEIIADVEKYIKRYNEVRTYKAVRNRGLLEAAHEFISWLKIKKESLREQGKEANHSNKKKSSLKEKLSESLTQNKSSDMMVDCEKCNKLFITEIKDLCSNCSIHRQVSDVRENMILKFETLSSTNNKSALIDYLKEKIDKGNKIIIDTIDGDSLHADDNYRKNRVAIILSWKDCVKYYSEQLDLLNDAATKNNNEDPIFSGLEPPRYYYAIDNGNFRITNNATPEQINSLVKKIQATNTMKFCNELKSKTADEIPAYLDFHLRCFKRNGGNPSEWLIYTKKQMPGGFSHQQQDAFLLWFENNRLNNETKTGNDMPEDNLNHNSRQYKEAFEKYNTACNELRKKYRVEYIITKEDLEDIPNAKEGDKTTTNPPIPNNTKEAFELFKNYYGAIQLEVNKLHFCQKYLAWNEPAIKAEIKIIEDWINKAEQIKYSDCAINPQGNIENSHSQEHEYLRLKNGFYESYLMTWEQHQYTSTASTVCGRYFLFYEYLKELVKGEICKVPSIIEAIRNNPKICDEILWSYYNMVDQPKERPKNYVGPLWRHNAPYQVNIYGAYPLMSQWEILEMHMANVDDKSGYYKEYKKEKVFESLKDYAKGFRFGFDNFFVDIAKEKLTSELTREEKVFAIIDYLTNPFNRSGFSISRGVGDVFSGWYDDGVNGGKYYCAWYFIMSNHRLFEPHFKEKNKLPEKDESGDFIEANFEEAADATRDLITKHLHCLSGKWRGVQIMTNDEYERLIKYALYTFKNTKLPLKIEAIKKGQSKTPELFYRQTIYLFWKIELKGNKEHRQDLWIDFYKKIFAPFCKNIKSEWSKNFSKSYKSYPADKNNIDYTKA